MSTFEILRALCELSGLYVVYGSDAGGVIRAGVRAELVAIPTLYTHSRFEAVHFADVEAVATLVEHFARGG